MLFPAAQQVNLPACSPHCPFNAERQAGFVNTGIVLGHRVDTAIVPQVTASGLKIVIL